MPQAEANIALHALTEAVAAASADGLSAEWPRLGKLLVEAADAARWHYVALLAHAHLVETSAVAADEAYIRRLVFNHRINDALYLKLYGQIEHPMRALRLPARRWNIPKTDKWISSGEPLARVAGLLRNAPKSASQRAIWLRHKLPPVLRRLNNRLKDGALMQMMRHAMALNELRWRRATKFSQQRAVHVRLHLASGFLTLSIRVRGTLFTLHCLIPNVALGWLDEADRAALDSHFAVRALSRKVFDLLCALHDKTADAAVCLPGLQLFYDLLLRRLLEEPRVAAAMSALGETPTLVIVTHGALAQIPFAALHDGEQYLGERFNIVQAPPLFGTDDFAPGDVDWESLEGGLPIPTIQARGLFDGARLPRARMEAVNFRRIFGVSTHGEESWTAEGVRALTQPPGLAFLSAHVAPSGDGAGGTLLETPTNAVIPFRDLVAEPMHADLLVLAGCVSVGQSDWLADAENSVVSMYRQAGVRAVIATLWPVDDHATSLYTEALMSALAAGKPRSVAHGDAQRRVLTARLGIGEAYAEQLRLIRQVAGGRPVSPEMSFAHPRFWAAFTLSGSWA